MDAHKEHPFSNMDALRFGWNATMANLKPLLLLGLVAGFLSLLHQGLAPQGARGLAPLLALVVQVLQVGVVMVYVRWSLMLVDEQAMDTRSSVLFHDFFGFLLTFILYGVVVTVGMVLLIVPGVVWGLKFAYCGFLVVDKGLDPIQAFKESAALTQGAKKHLLSFALLLFAVNLLGALAFGLGLLVTIPTSCIAAAHALRRLQARRTDTAQGERLTPAPQPG